jgi:hypothetical protein
MYPWTHASAGLGSGNCGSSKKRSKVSLHESQNITHEYVKERCHVGESTVPSTTDILQAEQPLDSAMVPSLLEVLQAQEAAAAASLAQQPQRPAKWDYRSRNHSVVIDDATNDVLSQLTGESRVTVNTPPLDFFAAAGAQPLLPCC